MKTLREDFGNRLGGWGRKLLEGLGGTPPNRCGDSRSELSAPLLLYTSPSVESPWLVQGIVRFLAKPLPVAVAKNLTIPRASRGDWRNAEKSPRERVGLVYHDNA